MSFLKFLRERKIINEDLYQIALEKPDKEAYICDILISAGEPDEEDVTKLKSEFFELDYTDLSDFSKIEGLDYASLEKSMAIPFRLANNAVKEIGRAHV